MTLDFKPIFQHRFSSLVLLTGLIFAAMPCVAQTANDKRIEGFNLLREGRFQDAEAIFRQLVNDSEDNPTVLYGYALALFNLRRYSEAERFAHEIVRKPGVALREQSDALVLLGVIRAVMKDTAGAVAYTQQAVTLTPDNFDAYVALGRAQFGAGDLTQAISAFRQAVRLNPRDATLLFYLATALENAGETGEALAVYQQLVSLAPNQAEGYLGLGVLLAKQNDNQDAAIDVLQQAIARRENSYEAHVTLGRVLVRVRRASEAIKHLQRAAELAPHNPEPRYQLVIAYRQLGKRTEAARESAIVKQLHETRRGASSNHQP